MSFRYDINGLRAIAVLAVVLFHFNPSWISSGFAGVDVFFVISGFLMTGIIFEGLEKGNFNLFQFYLSRAIRIIPALGVLILICYFLGFFLLSPISYEIFSKHGLSSLTFISNITYWKESGYFDISSSSKWLLHTWSLSVEWQFYIIYPLVLISLNKVTSLRKIQLFLILSTLVLIAVSIIVSLRWTNASYFLLPTRAWELLVGGCVYFYSKHFDVKSRFFEILGIILILSSYFLIPKGIAWPGYFAIVPVLGASFILIANQSDSVLTNNRFFQSLGNWSYSIYLWHWPVFVIMNLLNLVDGYEFFGILLSIVFGWISYKYIESIKSIKLMVILILAVLASSFFIYVSNGAEFRIDEGLRYSEVEKDMFDYGGAGFPANEPYHVGKKNNSDFIMFGDSFGQQYSFGLENSRYGFESYFDHGCLISPNLTRYFSGIDDKACSDSFSKIEEIVKNNPDKPVIMASAWKYKDSHGFKNQGPLTSVSDDEWYKILFTELDLIRETLGNNRNYYLVGRPQRDQFRIFDCLMKQGAWFSKTCKRKISLEVDNINIKLDEYAKKHSNVSYVNVNSKLCADKTCFVSDGRFPIHNDGSHLSKFGSRFVMQDFEEQLSKH